LDKLSDFLLKVPEVDDLPFYAKDARLRYALNYLTKELAKIDGNKDGFITPAGLILLF
jgi:hypothetical protein